MIIASIMLEKPQHLSADQVMAVANRRDRWVSKATVYNTLSLFARKGLLREVIVDPTRVFYDSNISEHHHIYNEDDGSLADISTDSLRLEGMPAPPPGTEIRGVDVIVRVRRAR
jgi:Fur family iron response transcriptional regulator